MQMKLVSDLQYICLSYLNILNYEKDDIIMSYSNNKKVYDIWYPALLGGEA
jgi:hypothetical protein